jgi:4-amino-4-deoxy-L-arabinose transferase-like glycosyltransferase
MEIKALKSIRAFILINWHILILVAFLILFSLQFFHFILNDKSIPQSDAVSHSFIAAKIYHISTGDAPPDYLRSVSYPPLVYLTSCLSFRLFDLSPQSVLIPLYSFCIIYLLSIFGIGNYFGGKIGGITSFFLGLSGYYLVFTGERYFLDLPAAALCIASIYFLLKSQNFENLPCSIMFGIMFGLAQLVKWNCCFFIIPALIVILLFNLGRNIRQFALPVIFSAISVLVFYFYIKIGMLVHKTPGIEKTPDFVTNFYLLMSIIILSVIILVIARVITVRSNPGQTGKTLWAFNFPISIMISQLLFYPVYLYSIRAYFDQFIQQQRFSATSGIQFSLPANICFLLLGFPLAGILVFAGFVFSIMIIKKIPELLALLAACITGLLLVSYGAPPDFRYILPAVGIMCVIGGYWTGIWCSNRKALIVLPMVFGIFALLPFISYFSGKPTLQPFRQQDVFSVRGISAFFKLNLYRINKPDSDICNFPKVLADIIQNRNNQTGSLSTDRPILIESLVTKEFENYVNERSLPSVRHDITQYIIEYYRIPGTKFMTFNRRIEQISDLPCYIIVFYNKQEEITDIKDSISKRSIKSSVVSLYNMCHGRNIAVLRLY